MSLSDQPAHNVAAPVNALAITIIATVATGMQSLDMTIVNVALPHMEASLNAAHDQIAWVLTSYIVAMAIATPCVFWLANRFGRKRLFIASITGFTVVSIFCGVAQTLPEMVLFRLVQGVCAAALLPLSQAIMLDTHPRESLGRAMALWGTGTTVAPTLGPILGGYLTDQFNWRWCFYVNLPIGIFGVIAAVAFIPETGRNFERKFDWQGFGFLALVLACFQLVMDRGEQNGWLQSPEIKIEAALALFGLYMFLVHSATTKQPFFDPAMFRDRTFMLSLILIAGGGMLINAQVFLAPLLMQTELNYPVITSGLLMGPRGVATIVATITYGRVSQMVDSRLLIMIGFLLCGVSMYIMSGWSLAVPEHEIVFASSLQGFGIGLALCPLPALTFSTLPPRLRTEGSGLFALIRNLAGAIGLSVIASQLTELAQANHARLGTYFTPFRHLSDVSNVAGTTGMKVLDLTVTQQANMIAFINVFRLLALLSFGFAMVPLIIQRGKQPPRRQENAAILIE